MQIRHGEGRILGCCLNSFNLTREINALKRFISFSGKYLFRTPSPQPKSAISLLLEPYINI